MKLAILDKDGTLAQPKSGSKFVQSPDDQELMPGVKEAIAALVADGYMLVIASNQGGVEAGHKSLDDAIAEMRYCMKLLPEIERSYFCPDFAGQTCYMVLDQVIRTKTLSATDWGFKSFRKPDPGMLLHALWVFKIAYNVVGSVDVVYIGDRPEDEQASEAAGIPFIHADVWRKG